MNNSSGNTIPVVQHRIALPALAAITTTALALALSTAAPAAKLEGLSPAVVKRIQTANTNYKECQQAAITAFNSKLINKVKFDSALDACRERFPAISLYGQCKREALSAAAATKKDPATALAECKKLLIAASFDRDQDIPFFTSRGQLFFSGIGMNRPQSIATLDPPNFDCDRLNKAVANPLEAQHILFGNHPKVFAGLGRLAAKEIATLARLEAPSGGDRKRGAGTKGFGRVFGNLDSPNATVFFPSAPCDFDGQLGKSFSGLSAFYLIDKEGAEATPYFGIAYYRPGVKELTTKGLVTKLIELLNSRDKAGGGYSAIIKNDTTAFVAKAEFQDFDEEKDPRNVCRDPRKHEFIGIVQATKDNPAKPRYLVVANVKNLCEYGDRLAARLTAEK
ncbi:MAG: hypothetical protein RIQ81_2159 [Pseudomonadota bacterium]|jgi:hypothetical protein